uniref:Methanethiol oxidase n=1 Tax=Zosterops lateralis melanops TaxID=1220523 RepID=A0A8D2PK65_ZOSLA
LSHYPIPNPPGLCPREEIIYIPCIYRNTGKKIPDFLATVDVDPKSPSYSQVPPVGKKIPKNFLDLWDEGVERRAPRLHKVVNPEDVFWKCDLGYPHTSHCLGSGEIMISTLGDPAGNGKGFGVLHSIQAFGLSAFSLRIWECPGFGSKDLGSLLAFNPRIWGLHSIQGFGVSIQSKDLGSILALDSRIWGRYGRRLNVWDWSTHRYVQAIDVGEDSAPLEIRFLHDPDEAQGFVGCTISSAIHRFYKTQDGTWAAHKVIQVPSKKVQGWMLPEMPGFITDILISLDDRFLYLSNWLHGDVRQYDISDPKHPKLVGQVFVGGSITRGGPVTVCEDQELQSQPEPLVIQVGPGMVPKFPFGVGSVLPKSCFGIGSIFLGILPKFHFGVGSVLLKFSPNPILGLDPSFPHPRLGPPVLPRPHQVINY